MTKCLEQHLLQSAYWLAAGLPQSQSKSSYASIIVARWAAIGTSLLYNTNSILLLSPAQP